LQIFLDRGKLPTIEEASERHSSDSDDINPAVTIKIYVNIEKICEI